MNSEAHRRILQLARTAPNVDNAQPFFFHWDEDRLLIFRDAERDRRRGNAGNTVSMVGLGCLLECIVIAASGEGLAADINFNYDPQQPSAPWLEIGFHPQAQGPDELLPGLTVRCSDRREYNGGDLSNAIFSHVADEAQQFSDCRLYFQNPSNQKLLDYILRCEGFLWADKQILPEMLSWVRWTQQEVQRTRDGMPWQSLNISFITSRVMRVAARSARLRQLLRRSGGPLRAQRKALEAQLLSSAAVGCITVQDKGWETMLQLGRLFLRVWVRLNMSGFGLQVMANPAIHVFQHVAGILPDDYPQESRQTFAAGEQILAETFSIRDGEIPAWMFRTGQSSPLPDKMKTLRLPLSEWVHSTRQSPEKT